MSVSKILRRSQGTDGPRLSFWCPGCDTCHQVPVAPNAHAWDWNGDVHRPTFTPSVLVTHTQRGVNTTCHSFVAEGVIDFLADSTHHALRGKHPIPEWPHPDWGGSEPASELALPES